MVYLMFLLGVVLGSIFTQFLFRRKRASGQLLIVYDGEEGPYLSLNMSRKELNDLEYQSEVVLRIKKI